jgi:hypothetical protein
MQTLLLLENLFYIGGITRLSQEAFGLLFLIFKALLFTNH